MKDLKELLDNMDKYAPYLKSSVLTQLSIKRQYIIAGRTIRAYKKANA